MLLLDAVNALFLFYVLLFASTLYGLFSGLRLLYKAIQTKDDETMRKAKFVLMFTVIAILGIAVACFFVTGKLPVF